MNASRTRSVLLKVQLAASTLLIAWGLVACGGGRGEEPASGPLDAYRSGALGVQTTAGNSVVEPRLSLAITAVTKVRETRVSRTVFDYTFTVRVRSNGDPYDNIRLELVGVGTGSAIVDGDVHVGSLATGSEVTPGDTITIRHDRSVPYNAAALVWRYSGVPSNPLIVPGAALYSTLVGEIVQGEPFSGNLRLAPNDPRNQIVGLAVSNATPGGVAPQIDLSGTVNWTPGEADFDTTGLTITAALADSSQSVIAVPVRVTRTRTVATVTLSGAGLYSDPLGLYLVDLSPGASGGTVSGTLQIQQRYDRNGRFSSRYITTDPTLVVKALREPAQPMTSSAAALSRSTRLQVRSTQIRLNNATQLPAPVIGLPQLTVQDTGNEPLPYSMYLTGQMVYQAGGSSELPTTRSDVRRQGLVLPRPADVGRIQSNCVRPSEFWNLQEPSRTNCSDLPGTPVILLHGYVPESYGGGTGTWGGLATELKKRGHPVFELRWDTGMRFEEAAGLLVQLGRAVAEATERRPFVIAHSFGGIVAHLAIAGEGMIWNSGSKTWDKQSADSSDSPLFDGVVTLGSPLSGVNDVNNRPFVVGRDDEDFSINLCSDVTCVQSGASDVKNFVQLKELVRAIDGEGSGRAELSVGESIVRTREAWKKSSNLLPRSSANIHTIVSIRKAPYLDIDPDLNDSTSYKLGDGLISLIGQSVLTNDFSAAGGETYGNKATYNMQSWLSLIPGLSPSFFEKMDNPPAPGATDILIHASINNRNYHFAPLAAHTTPQDLSAIREGANSMWKLKPYRIAHYKEDVEVGVRIIGVQNENLYTAKHPLRYVMDTLLKQTNPTPTVGPNISLRFRAAVKEAGTTVIPQGVVADLTVVDASGTVVGSTERIEAASGTLEFDVVALIRRAIGAAVLDYSVYKVRMDVGDNRLYIPETRILEGWGNTSASNTLPDFELIRLAEIPSSLVAVNGVVIGSNSAPIPNATVRLVRGTNLTASEILQWQDGDVARRLTTNASGQFQAAGLLKGNYVALVSAAGYADLLVPSVTLNGAGSLEFRLVRTASAAPVTLTPLGPEFRVNTTTIYDQFGTEIVKLAGGNTVFGWMDSSRYTEGLTHRAQILTPEGNRVGSEIVISPYSSDSVEPVSLIPLADGGFVAVWRGFEVGAVGQPGVAYKIYMQRFSADGSKIDSARVLCQAVFDSPTPCFLVGLSSQPNGKFAVSWKLGTGRDNVSVNLQAFSESGTPLSGPVSRTVKPSAYVRQISVSEGRYALIWPERLDCGGVFCFNYIRAQFFESTGAPVPGPVVDLVNSSDLWNIIDFDVFPSAGGGFAVTWVGNRNLVPELSVAAEIFSPTGQKIGQGLNIVSTNLRRIDRISSIFLSDGSFATVVNTREFGGINQDFAKAGLDVVRLSATGQPLGASRIVESTKYQYLGGYNILALSDGRYLIDFTYDDVQSAVAAFGSDGVSLGSPVPLGSGFSIGAGSLWPVSGIVQLSNSMLLIVGLRYDGNQVCYSGFEGQCADIWARRIQLQY